MSRISDDIIVTKSAYDDFSMPCNWRNFEFIVENHVMYVNAGWMAEMSPFFASFCYGETQHEPLVVDDLKYEEVLEFLRCIYYCPTRKPVTVSNVALVMRLATRFDMRPVMARCEMFVSRTAPTLDRHRLFQVTSALSQCDPNCSTMTLLIDKLAGMKDEDLNEMQFHQMPGEVVHEIYSQKRRRRLEKRKRICCLM